MTKKLIGYMAWDFASNTPLHGARRFRVWTTEKECRAKHGLEDRSNSRGVKPIFVDVDA